MMTRIHADPARRFEPFPLTEMQQAYWLGRNSEFELGGVGIHLYEELECSDLDVARLSEAWQRTIDRHDALRTVVLNDGRQRVLESAEYQIDCIDASTEAQLLDLRNRLSHRRYAIEGWPNFEILACRLDGKRVRLFISVDLNFVDLHGFGLILHDWTEFYRSLDVDLPQSGIAFRDYVIGLREVEASGAYRESREYWRDTAARLPASPALPAAKPAGAIRAPRFERRCGTIDRQTWTALKKHAAAAGVTPSCMALAVYAEVLRHWSTAAAFTVNVALRNSLPLHPDIGQVAGMFTSPAPIAFLPQPSETFDRRARAAQASLSDLLRHRAGAGVWMLREYARAQGKGPFEAILPVVFTSTLNVTPHPLVTIERFGERVYHLIQTPQVCLDLQLYEREGAMAYHWDTVSEYFPPGVPEAMSDAFDATLSSLAAESATRRVRVCEMPARQRDRCAAVNATEAPLQPLLIDQLVWRNLAARGNQPAVIAAGEVATHEHLHRAAVRIADRLRHLGAAPDRPVAIVIEKGWLQYAAVHGVLLAGAAYVPVSPDMPDPRRRYLLLDSEARIAVTTRSLSRRLHWPEGIECVTADECGECQGEQFTASGRSPADLAYVLYTSGSTGQPKGVMIEHRSVVNRLLDVNQRFGIVESDRVLALTALHHDLSVYDLFGILAAGGAAVIPNPDQVREPAAWADLMRAHRITIWNSVPAYLDMLVTYLEHCGNRTLAPRDLRLVLLAGDWIPPALPDRVRAIVPGARVIALGGPTETTVWDICFPVERVDPAWSSIPYGKPMRNSRYYVMNEDLEERPDWVCGELCIGGAGLGRGYWKDAERTARSFVRHPSTGERLYRSGDLGRYLPDGNIEFMGRSDSQLKIRGHRIEAEEVAVAIRKHARVANVIVRAEGDRNRGLRLAAYVQPKKEAPGYDPAPRKLGEPEQIQFRLEQLGLRRDFGCGPGVFLPDEENGQRLPWSDRRSCRSFRRETVGLDAFGKLIGLLRGVSAGSAPLPRYLYPSAGSLYPVRCYICVNDGAVTEVPQGTYYYHPIEHRLRLIHSDVPGASAHLPHNRCLMESAGFMILLVGHLAAIEPAYGDLARDYCLLEAGYMGQLLMSGAASLGIGLCPIGDLDRQLVGALLGSNAEDQILHALAGGIPGEPCRRANASGGNFATEIRELLRAKLPEYMIPKRIVMVDEFRLSANGKIDLSALPEPITHQPLLEAVTPREAELAAVLGEILGMDRVPTDRPFMELGCTSVQLVELMVRLQRQAQREISIADVFAHPTIQSLASFLNGCDDDRDTEALERAGLRIRMRSARVS